jgi:hypothetical protein
MGDKIEIEVIAKGLDAVKKDLEGLQKEVKGTAKTSVKSSSILSSAWTQAALAVTVAIAGIKKAMDFSKEGAKIQQSMEATSQQFGVSIDNMLKKLKEASGGTVSNADLIQSANKAMALNVTKDLDKMSTLLSVARARAKAMGIDTAQAFEDISVGIGRNSPLILDNLGIITKGFADEAKAAGKAYDAQFLLNKVLEDGAEIVERSNPKVLTMAEKLQKLEAGAKNAGDSVKRAFAAEIVEAMTDFGDETEGALKKIEEAIVPIRRGFRALFAIVKLAIANIILPFQLFAALISPITGTIETIVKNLENLKKVAAGLGDALTAGNPIEMFKALKNISGETFESIKNGAKKLGSNINENFTDAINGIGDTWKESALTVASVFQQIDDMSIEQISEEEKRRRVAVENEKARLQEIADKKKQFLKEESERLKAFRAKEAAEQKQHEQDMLNVRREAYAASRQLVNDFFSFTRQVRSVALNDSQKENEKAAERERKTLENQKENGLITEQQYADGISEINEKLNAKTRALKKKAAIADKRAAIVQSVFNTAMAVTKALASAFPPANFILAGIAGSLGAAQTALIAATPIPQFRQGTNFAPGGRALVGEAGPEIVDLPQGARVVPNNQISNKTFDNKQISINVQAQDPIQFVNELRQTYGLDVFQEA